jgi:hypothetical protein
MASSKEAFMRFGTWRKLHTVLRLTVLTKGGKPEKLIGVIASVDDDEFLVGFATRRKDGFRTIWFGDAEFGLQERALSAERPTGDVLRLEEL